MLVKVRELVRFDEENTSDITYGMGIDMNLVYIPVEDTKSINEYIAHGVTQWEDIDIDDNEFTLFRGEYIKNDELEQAKMFAEWADNAPKTSSEEIAHYEKMERDYEGQFDHEARA